MLSSVAHLWGDQVPDFAQNVLATVGVIATIIAAVVTIIMWREGRADRRVKRLFTWEVVSNVEALSMTDPPSMHKGAAVADTSLEALAQLYVAYLEDIVRQAHERFEGIT
jgi:hypothetical protein